MRRLPHLALVSVIALALSPWAIAAQQPPAGYPKDVPVYPGSKAVVGSSDDGDAGITFTTVDEPTKVVRFYRDELPKNGWRDVEVVELAGTFSIGATKGKRDLGIAITRLGDKKTNITIGVTED